MVFWHYNILHGNTKIGQSTVEFTILLPLMLLAIVALAYISLAFNCYMTISTASREGAREGARSNSAESANRAALSSLRNLRGGDKRVEVSFPEGRNKGKPISVTVHYKMPSLLPFLSRIIPRLTFSRTTTMILERNP